MIDWAADDTVWLTRQQAAEEVGCSVDKITDIAREMVELGLDGVWVSSGRMYRIERKALKDYLYHRHKMKCDKRFGRI